MAFRAIARIDHTSASPSTQELAAHFSSFRCRPTQVTNVFRSQSLIGERACQSSEGAGPLSPRGRDSVLASIIAPAMSSQVQEPG